VSFVKFQETFERRINEGSEREIMREIERERTREKKNKSAWFTRYQ
jgi:hypothetical protein